MPAHAPGDPLAAGTTSLLGALRLFAENSGGAVSDCGSAFMVLSGTKTTGAFHSGAVRIAVTSPADVVREVRTFASAHQREMVLWASSHTDEDIIRSAPVLGLEPFSTATGMALFTPPSDSPAPPNTAVERVTDLHGVATFTEVHATVALESGSQLGSVHFFSCPEVLLNQAVQAFVVRAAGHPVACAMVICDGRNAGVYWVASAPTARNRGYGTLAARAASVAGFGMGAAIVILQSTSLGLPVYRKLGFTPICEYRRYRIGPAPEPRA